MSVKIRPGFTIALVFCTALAVLSFSSPTIGKIVDTAQKIQGAVDEGATYAGYPAGMGGKSPTGKMRAVLVDESGNLQFVPASGSGGYTPVNVAQIASAAVSAGHGTSDTGTQRVELPSDGTGQVTALNTPDKTVSGSLVNLNDAATVTLAGQAGVGVEITGVWTGVVTFEGEINAVWVAVKAIPLGGGANVTTATANGSWEAIGAGVKAFRVRFSTATSGTVSVALLATTRARIVRVLSTDASNLLTTAKTDQTTPGTTDHVSPINGQNGVAGGSGVNGATVQRVTVATDDTVSSNLGTLAGAVTASRLASNPIVGQAGMDGGGGVSTAKTLRTILSNDTTTRVAGTVATYIAYITTAVTAAANPTDIITIYGVNGKTVKILNVGLTMAQTVAFTDLLTNPPTVTYFLRSSANTAGTTVAATTMSYSTGDPATPGATVVHYTANPTGLGVSVGIAGWSYTAIGAIASTETTLSTGMGSTNGGNAFRSVTLNSATEGLAVHMSGTAHTGLQFTYAIIWTEE